MNIPEFIDDLCSYKPPFRPGIFQPATFHYHMANPLIFYEYPIIPIVSQYSPHINHIKTSFNRDCPMVFLLITSEFLGFTVVSCCNGPTRWWDRAPPRLSGNALAGVGEVARWMRRKRARNSWVSRVSGHVGLTMLNPIQLWYMLVMYANHGAGIWIPTSAQHKSPCFVGKYW